MLRDVFAALKPGGLLAVIEMDALPSFLPDDVRIGRPGTESRLHEALAQAGWNAHPDWRPDLERAGFEIAGQRTFTSEVSAASPNTSRYAHAYLRDMRSALDDQLVVEDLDTLDHLLADENLDAILRRPEVTVRGGRTAWAARRPLP